MTIISEDLTLRMTMCLTIANEKAQELNVNDTTLTQYKLGGYPEAVDLGQLYRIHEEPYGASNAVLQDSVVETAASSAQDVSKVVSPPYTIFMGVDKHENEELIRWGWPEDVWFHVDKVSSAHVYLRLHEGETIDDLPQAVIEDCVQLVKANSIQGNKMNNIDVVYTMWANLKKTANMDVGQVGFHKDKEVIKVRVEKRNNEIVNRLNKTKQDRNTDLRGERENRDRKEREDQRKKQAELKQKEKEEEKLKQEQAEVRSYASLMKAENMTSNKILSWI